MIKHPVERVPAPQLVGDKIVHRNDHVWLLGENGRPNKCVLCGAITRATPPYYPTSNKWQPDDYEVLTQAERDLCPYVEKVQ